MDLLFRCTYVEGSSTLITHCGLMRWIATRLTLKTSDGQMKRRLRGLASRLYETSDQARINGWSIETLSGAVDDVQISESEA